MLVGFLKRQKIALGHPNSPLGYNQDLNPELQRVKTILLIIMKFFLILDI